MSKLQGDVAPPPSRRCYTVRHVESKELVVNGVKHRGTFLHECAKPAGHEDDHRCECGETWRRL